MELCNSLVTSKMELAVGGLIIYSPPLEITGEEEVVLHVLVRDDVARDGIGEVEVVVVLAALVAIVVGVDEHAAERAGKAAVPGVAVEVDAVADAAPVQDHGDRRDDARGHVVVLHRQRQQLPRLWRPRRRRASRGAPLRVLLEARAGVGSAAAAHRGGEGEGEGGV